MDRKSAKQADCTVLTGSNLDHLPTFADCVFDSCVTDPPYELGFMGKAWDKSGIAYSVELWREVYRVLKPGAYLLAFGGSRTYHRMACAIEDAGFEIRDQIQWIYGSGFPKSLDVSKAIDKMNGAERVIGKTVGELNGRNIDNHQKEHEIFAQVNGWDKAITAPASDDAKTWDGWGTALKPAHEPIVMARKPLEKGLTVAQNVLKWGTGAINVDGCRIETDEIISNHGHSAESGKSKSAFGDFAGIAPHQSNGQKLGRFPANVIHDGGDEVLAGFPHTSSGAMRHEVPGYGSDSMFLNGRSGPSNQHGDEGSAARFFYSPKASKYDREAGLPEAGLPEAGRGEMTDRVDGSDGLNSPRAGAGRTSGGRNHHPTVKPTDLMQYLCRLVTPPGGLILEPFLGSGSTAKAALIERFSIVGIELNPEYAKIAEARCKQLQVKLF